MAQQSVRRGWDNQGLPLCFEHATGDLDPVRELPYRPAAVFLPHSKAGQMTASGHAQQRPQRFPLPGGGRPQMEGGVHRWEAVIRRDELERPRCAVGRRPIAGRSLVPRRHPKPFPIPDLSAVTAERGGSTSTDLPRSGAEASVFLRFGIDRSASRPELERPPKMG
jgi:hypothetical protein